MLITRSTIDLNLILTGYAGPNQLAIARQTAQFLRMPFVDFDTRFEERHGMTASQMKNTLGEKVVRLSEQEVLDELMLYRATVINISGKVILDTGTLPNMLQTGVVLCTVAALNSLLQRLHLSMGVRFHDPRERDLALGVIRREWKIRDQEGIVTVDTTDLNERQIIEKIALTWREHSSVVNVTNI